MPSEPCSFTDYEEGINFDEDDPDFSSNQDMKETKISFFADRK